MPEPVPVAVSGRLAVDQRWQGCGIGSGLLKDAVIRALLVHALDEQAKAFYLGHGFIESPIEPMTEAQTASSGTIRKSAGTCILSAASVTHARKGSGIISASLIELKKSP